MFRSKAALARRGGTDTLYGCLSIYTEGTDPVYALTRRNVSELVWQDNHGRLALLQLPQEPTLIISMRQSMSGRGYQPLTCRCRDALSPLSFMLNDPNVPSALGEKM